MEINHETGHVNNWQNASTSHDWTLFHYISESIKQNNTCPGKMFKLVVLIASMTALSCSQQSSIEEDHPDSSKYFIPNFKANWFKSVEYCHYIGQRLAVIETGQAETNLYSAIRASDAFNALSTRVWVGANDLADEGNFHWHATGKRIRYANWNPGQPDNWDSRENCVEVGINTIGYLYAWRWNDDDCKTLHYFACEDVTSESEAIAEE